MRKLSGNIEQNALQTEWSGWIRDVVHAFGLVDVMRPDTWRVLAPLAESVAAVRWLVGQIRRCNTMPPELPHEEAKFYLLAAFCPDNRFSDSLLTPIGTITAPATDWGCCPVSGSLRR